jgi:thrombospondin 2/3/4/5
VHCGLFEALSSLSEQQLSICFPIKIKFFACIEKAMPPCKWFTGIFICTNDGRRLEAIRSSFMRTCVYLLGVQCVEINQHPYYRCGACPSGFSGNGSACHDIDEVIISCWSPAVNAHLIWFASRLQCDLLEPCDQRVRCKNLSPGFRCDPCPSGFHGHHSQGLYMTSTPEYGFQKQRCDDIDECREGIARCGGNSECVNTEGSYECTCPRGYARDSSGCVQVPGMCPDGTICDRNAACQHVGGNRYRYELAS